MDKAPDEIKPKAEAHTDKPPQLIKPSHGSAFVQVVDIKTVKPRVEPTEETKAS